MGTKVGEKVIVDHSTAAKYKDAIKEWQVRINGEGLPACTYYPDKKKDAFGNYPAKARTGL